MTTIEWTDATWNPVVGCTKVSAGCANCYAETMSARLAGMAEADELAGRDPGRKGDYRLVVTDGPGAKRRFSGRVQLRPEALDDPFRWRKPRRVFVNSMGDLFHGAVPFDFIDRVFAAMALTPQHTYQILTKRPERMAEYFDEPHRHEAITYASNSAFDGGHPGGIPSLPLPNVWLGTSVEDQRAADSRIRRLLDCPAAVRFLSCEPLIGPVDLGDYLCRTWIRGGLTIGTYLDWVIAGGESGPGARPMDAAWVRQLRDDCVSAGVPFFFKQWGGPRKHTTGRELDGRTWDEMPTETTTTNPEP